MANSIASNPSGGSRARSRFGRWTVWLVSIVAALYVAGTARPAVDPKGFNLEQFSQITVLHGGRVKPIDTVARTSLLMLSGKQTLKTEAGGRSSAVVWLLDMLFAPERANQHKVFRIDDPDVLGVLGLEPGVRNTFALDEFASRLDEVQKQAMRAFEVEESKRSRFEGAILNLQERIVLYQRLQNTMVPAGATAVAATLQSLSGYLGTVPVVFDTMPPAAKALLSRYATVADYSEFRSVPSAAAAADDNAWTTMAEGLRKSFSQGAFPAGLLGMASIADAWQAGNAAVFNDAVRSYLTEISAQVPRQQQRAVFETTFNRVAPFYRSMVLYVIVLVLGLAYWISRKEILNAVAFNLLWLGFAVHTLGLFSRIVLQGRPPVTNLYSSAVFVGWGAVLFGAAAEWKFRRGMASVMAAAVGFVTLIIAHHLSLQGDTMEMMRAVLDSNFWLTTHVVCITIGYSATFIAGAAGIVYLLRRAFDRSWSPESSAELSRILYGLVCFSAFFSFLGTVLGGIWADQSWGRFWGWDPKENGAMLIVLWSLAILHAKSGRIAGETALMAMAVFGNVITAVAWFGVNMLNIGLHSYGYMYKAFTWLVVFTISQIIIIMLALLPRRAKAPNIS